MKMNVYYKKIIKDDKVKKLELYVRINSILYYLVRLLFLIFMGCIIMAIALILFQYKYVAIIYIVAIIIFLMSIWCYTELDPSKVLRYYSVSDRIFIYLKFLQEYIDKYINENNTIKQFMIEEQLKTIIRKISENFYDVENNFKNLFIWTPDTYELDINEIKLLCNTFNKNLIDVIKSDEKNELISLIKIIISLYEINLSKILNIEIKETRKELSNVLLKTLNKINKFDDKHATFSKNFKALIISVIISAFMIIYYFFRNKFPNEFYNFFVYVLTFFSVPIFVYQSFKDKSKN